MNLKIPGVKFLISSVPLEFDTDEYISRFESGNPRNIDADHIVVLMQPHIQRFHMSAISEISLFDEITLPDKLNIPEIFDETQNLHGKKILVFMLNGWGDTILIQPALRAFYTMIAATGNPPRMTLGCNWIYNFPYLYAPYIHGVCPNILTLKKLCSFDILVNLIPINFQRSPDSSMRDLCLNILNPGPEFGGNDPPSLQPDPQRISIIKPVLDQIRKKTGKNLLCVNWKSRFHHKNASPQLFSQVVDTLHDRYQAVLF